MNRERMFQIADFDLLEKKASEIANKIGTTHRMSNNTYHAQADGCFMSCSNSCAGRCAGSCKGSCTGKCGNDCTGNCSGYCKGGLF